MAQFFKKHPFITAFIVIALLLTLILVTRGRTNATGVENAVGAVLAPVEAGVSTVTRNVGNWFRVVFGISNLQEENENLKTQLENLRGDVSLLTDLQAENKRLKELANYIEENKQFDIISTTVIGKSPGYWFDTITLFAGRNHGVAVGMPVITPQGLVGRISEVGHNYSKVLTIIDSDSSVSAIIDRTRVVGVLRGTVQIDDAGGLCRLHNLPEDNDLVPGDRVLTSGLGGVFPKGLPIGDIDVVISTSDSGTERTASVTPAVDFSNLEEVMIIKQVFEQIEP